jgi:RNA polymerase sigma factor (sigma-70 family)
MGLAMNSTDIPVGKTVSSAGDHPLVVDDLGRRSAEQVFAEEWVPICRIASLMVGDRHLGEDLAQEAFARWYARRDSVNEPAAFLRTVVVNLARGTLRRRVVSRRWAYLFEVDAEQSVMATPDVLSDLIHALPVRQRAAIVLRFYERRSEAEIAQILGCRVGTVKSLLSRALASLRMVIEK